MDLLTAIKISASGMSAQRLRLNVLSSNLANANSTRNADGTGPYQRKDPIFQEVKAEQFDKVLDRAEKELAGVEVSDVVTDETPGIRVFDPTHPDADKEGYVTMPNVNVVTELTDIMQTSNTYEANAAAIRAAKDMIGATLAIGERFMRIQGPSFPSIVLSPELEKALPSKATKESSFSDMLANKMQEVDQAQKAADVAAENFASGKSQNLHGAILAMEMADTSLRLAVTVRNKVIEAYQEIMRMPV